MVRKFTRHDKFNKMSKISKSSVILTYKNTQLINLISMNTMRF